jgi:hypothetical protein
MTSSRPRFVRGAAVLAVVLAVCSAAPAVAAGVAPQRSRVTGITLSWYPGPQTGYPALEGNGVIPDPHLLNELATDYANGPRIGPYGRVTAGPPNMQDFLLIYLPVWLNEVVSGTAPNSHGLDPANPDDLGRILWVDHLAGYYGGVWLRKDFMQFGLPFYFGLPFSNAGIDNFYRMFVDPIRTLASSGSGSSVVGAAGSTLRSGPITAPVGIDSATLVTQILPPDNNLGGFGYDATWLADILPPRLDSPQHASPSIANFFSADPNGLLNASYGMREAPYLTEARAAYAKVTAARGNTSARLHEVVNGKPGQPTLQQEQLRFQVYGNAVYGIGIPGASSYRNFNQDQYDRVLTWASYAVMSNQANALDAIAAYASQNVTAARSQLRATVVWAAYVGAYAWGNLNSHVTAAQPMSTLLPSFIVGP